jgi:hypothetical protein
MQITILKWEEYNYRKDIKTPRWFRFEHSFFENHEFYDFTHTEMVCWVYLLCLASKKNSATILVNKSHVEHIGKIKFKDFEKAIQKLEQIQCVSVDVTDTNGSVRIRNVHVTDTCATLHNKTLHNTTERDAHVQGVFDFDSLYQKFPRKQGKQRGLKLCRQKIKTETAFKELELAIRNYTEYVQKNKTEQKFIKHFSTFMGEWEDWIRPEPDVLSVKTKQVSAQKQEWLERLGIKNDTNPR